METANNPEFVILGVTIQTNGSTVFRDENELQITANDFFTQALTRLVEAEGTLSNGMIVADEVELED